MAQRAQDIIQRLQLVVEGIDQLNANFDKIADKGKKTFEEIERSGTKSVEAIAKRFDDLGGRFERAGAKLQGVGRRMSLFLTAPIIAGFGVAVKAATDFESAMADVRKVVDFPTPESFTRLGEDLRAMSLELPVAAEGLAEIAAAAGQAGVAAADLVEFTELVAQVSVAFEITAGEAGTALAQIKTALGLTIPQVRLLSDAMNYLANNMATSEAEVLRVVARVGSLAEVAGVATKDIAAVGAAMIATGVDADRASTGLQNLLLRLQAGEQATDGQKAAWESLGYTSVEVARRIQTEGAGLILEIFEKINEQAPEVRASILEALFDRRVVAAASPLINRLEVLRKSLGLVADESEYMGATLEEFSVRAETSANKFQLFQNHINNLAIVIGSELLPMLVEVTEWVSEWLASMSEAEASTIKWGAAIAGVAAILGPLILGIGTILSVVGGFLTNVGKLILFLYRWRAAFVLVGAATGAVSAPVALLIAGIAALAAGIVILIGNHNDAADAAVTHADAMRELKTARDEFDAGVEGSAEKLGELGRAHMQTALDAVEAARIELEALRELKAAREGMIEGPLGEGPNADFVKGAIPGRPAEMDELDNQLQEAENRLQRAANNVKQRMAEIGRASGEATKNVKDLTDAASDSGDAIAKVAQRVIGVTRGMERTDYAVDQFGRVTGAVEETGKALDETAGKVIGVVRGTERTEYAVDQFGRVQGAIKATGDEAEEAGEKTKTEADVAEESAQRQVAAIKTVQEEHTRTVESLDQVKTKVTETGEQAVTTTQRIGEAGAEIARVVPETAQAVATEVATISEALPETIGGNMEAMVERVTTSTTAITEAFSTALSSINSKASDTSGAVGNLFDTAAAKVVAAFVDMETSVTGIFRSIVNAAESAANSIVRAMERATRAAKAAESAAKSAAAAGAKGYAMGGPVWGAGTSTSDSILARLSRGEYVIRASAVMRYGTRLFDMLNNMSLPKDLIKGFNLGGLIDKVTPVGAGIPLLANGGEVPTEGRVPLLLQLPNGHVVETSAKESAVDQILRHVTGKRLRSLGKTPSGR